MTLFPDHLIEGYKSFRDGRLNDERQRYQQLAEGQKPKVMIIGCCDSRAAPETIFNTGPGELFVVRNVANLVPPYELGGEYHGTSAALEFAVQALKVENIVVMGHGRCGGISAFLSKNQRPLSPGNFIGKWVSLIEPATTNDKLEALNRPELDEQGKLERTSIIQSIAYLRTFPCVDILERRGDLKLHGAWFDISNGELEIFDEDNGTFIPAPNL
ncbi:MAG: carbonate dehydratase [Hyphomicrobiales bacterium]|nr:MAG: carbonate dehydratase [Hyphomicrobiales bacterium]